MTKVRGGYFVISLDFELHWGMFDKVSVEEYGEHYRGVQKALPEILDCFREHDIHATWATIGMLMARSRDELFSLLPPEKLRPQYKDMRVSSYYHIAMANIGKDERDDPHHFAPTLVEEIITTDGQELASHTFSHFYCIDGKENRPDIFRADCERMENVARAFGKNLTSIIFPRNQTSPEALTICAEHNITAYRGTETHTLYRPRGDRAQTLTIRALRLLDAYFNISGNNTTSLGEIADQTPYNIRSSRFLRPYSRRLRFLERMRMRRIKQSMTYAAKNNQIFHLWWHPHNFGINQKENMRNLRDLIAHYEVLKETYGMESKNMREMGEILDEYNNTTRASE